MDGGTLTGIIVAATGLFGGGALFIKARPEAKKLKTDGAATLVVAATAHSAELSDQVAELQNETRKLWQAQREQETRITTHLRWDAKVVDTLRGLGGEISDPPPLYPEGT